MFTYISDMLIKRHMLVIFQNAWFRKEIVTNLTEFHFLAISLSCGYGRWHLGFLSLKDIPAYLWMGQNPSSNNRYVGLLRTTSGLLPDYFELRRTTSGLLTKPDTGVFGTRPEDQPGPWGNYLLDFLSPGPSCVGSVYIYSCRIRAGFPYICGGSRVWMVRW